MLDKNMEIENATSHMVKPWKEWKKGLVDAAYACPQILDSIDHPTWAAFDVAEDIREAMFQEVIDECGPVEWEF